jgi:S1-C subfamily serine protease
MRTLSIVSLILSIIFWSVGWFSFKTTDSFQPIDHDLYEEVYKPFVLVSVSVGDDEIRRGSGFLVKHVEDGECRVLAVTNHHVVYGTESMTSDENVPNLGDAVVTIQLAKKFGEILSEIHLAEPLRTSKYADLSLLYIPHMTCVNTPTAELVDDARLTRIGAKVIHMTAPGAYLGNVEVIPGHITRIGVDPMDHTTFSTTVMIVSGMSGSPVFVKTWSGYKVVGIVKAHFTLDGVNNAGTNYIATAEELGILIGK